VELHTWNRAGSTRTSLSLDASDGAVIPGHGPETFCDTDPSLGIQFTGDVCQHGGENANVTVGVRDPDGVTRRLHLTLLGRKAAAVAIGSTASRPASAQALTGAATADPTQLGQVTTGTLSSGAQQAPASTARKSRK
jgi:hypothetical protein